MLPDQSYRWHHLEGVFRELTRLYGYKDLRTPTFEDTGLFVRTAGETSDIVSKEMYSFKDKGDRDITLKPEGTAPAMRAVIEHSLCPPGTILRMSYITPIFRYGRPQKGRLREAHQFGLELVGSSSVTADAEVIEITSGFFTAVGITDHVAQINTLGRDQCRARFREAILSHMASFLAGESEEVRAKANKNPLGLLDSKDPATQAALQGLPPILDFLEDDSKARFDELQRLLCEAGVPFRVAPDVVRGLDYYTETVFEVLSDKLGAQSSLCGGGRYDNLVKDLGGSPTPSVGVGIGIERTMLVLESMGKLPSEPQPLAFVVSAGDEAKDAIHALARALRRAGVSTLVDLDHRSLKSQLRQADKSGARFALVIGPEELAKGTVQVRNLQEGSQVELPTSQAIKLLGEQAPR